MKIHSVAWTKVKPEFADSIAYSADIALESLAEPIEARGYTGPGGFVPEAFEPSVKLSGS